TFKRKENAHLFIRCCSSSCDIEHFICIKQTSICCDDCDACIVAFHCLFLLVNSYFLLLYIFIPLKHTAVNIGDLKALSIKKFTCSAASSTGTADHVIVFVLVNFVQTFRHLS